jgi:hypothetical protein
LKRNPVVKGRMYKVSGGGVVRGIRFNKNGTTDVLVVPGGKKRNPKKKRRTNTKKKRKTRNARKTRKPRKNVKRRKASKKKK